MRTGGVNCKRPAIWACASFGFILSTTACLSYDANGFVSLGVGNRSCDQYVADAHEPQRGFVYETWLSGYLTAFNAYNLGIVDILAGRISTAPSVGSNTIAANTRRLWSMWQPRSLFGSCRSDRNRQ